MKKRNLAILIKLTYVLLLTFIALLGMTYASYTFQGSWPVAPGGQFTVAHANDAKNAFDEIYGAIGIDAGKMTITSETLSTDPENTVGTKKYIDDKFAEVATLFNECSWRDGSLCEADELMRGDSATQVYCCGATPRSCTATGWTNTGTRYCTADCSVQGCGTDYGTWMQPQTRTLADCKVETRNFDTGNWCVDNCGSCR